MVQQNPLTYNVPITDKLGNPTPEFQRKWALQTQINATIIDLSTASAVSAVLDKLGLATGDMLYRASTGWVVRTPGSTATLLQIVGGLPTWSTMSGDATIAAGGVLTIGNAKITYAKIQNVTDARLLGRSNGSAGPPIEITVGAGLSLSAGSLTATGGSGVTSVGLSLDSGLYTVSGTPVTTTGTLTGTLNTQVKNTVFAGPATGVDAKPTFRAHVAADIPDLGANPSATGSDVAVNGSATTYMRSDGAFAIQKCSAAAFGLAKVDNSTITSAAGVISTPGGANPSATGSDVAVNGSAATFMRSDGAPAIQKTSASVFGVAKVDGTSITASSGIISAAGFVPLAAAFHPGYVSGRFYSCPFTESPGTITGAANTLYPMQFYCGATTTFTKISFHCNSGNAGNAEMGVYANSNGQPGALLTDAGSHAVALGSNEVTGLTITLTPGWYWLVVAFSSASVVFFSQASNTGLSWLFGQNALNAAADNMTGAWTYSAGALPNPFPAPSYPGTTKTAALGLRL